MRSVAVSTKAAISTEWTVEVEAPHSEEEKPIVKEEEAHAPVLEEEEKKHTDVLIVDDSGAETPRGAKTEQKEGKRKKKQSRKRMPPRSAQRSKVSEPSVPRSARQSRFKRKDDGPQRHSVDSLEEEKKGTEILRSVQPSSLALTFNFLKPLTLFKPFKLSSGFTATGKPHPATAFLHTFQDKYAAGDAKYFGGISFLSERVLLRLITMTFYDKAVLGADNAGIRNASLGEYIYDTLANKYGIGKLAERKLKEVFVTCLKYSEHAFKVELFQRFLGISLKKDLSNDDLSHFYFLNRIFLANECIVPRPT